MVKDGLDNEVMEDASVDYSASDGELGYGSKFFKSPILAFIKDSKAAQAVTVVPPIPPS